MDIKQYFFVNKDLNMTPGKVASQVGHASQFITEEIIRSGYEKRPPPESYFTYMIWKKNCIKIILSATAEQLIELQKMSEARSVVDNGQTEVPNNSLTVVGFFPGAKIEGIENYKLY